MRWQQLFADLQAQFDEEEAASERSESASWARAEMGAVRLSQRLLGSLGAPVSVTCRGAGPARASQTSGRTGCCSRTTAAGRTWWRRRRSGQWPAWQGDGSTGTVRGGAGAAGPAPGVAGACARSKPPSRWSWTTGSAERNAGPGRRGLRGAGGAPGGPAAPVGGGAGGARDRHRGRSPSSGRGRPGSLDQERVGLAAGAAGSGCCGLARGRLVGDGARPGLGVLLLDEPLELSVSTRHCPRPPIWMAISSLRRTRAYACDHETFRISATSSRVRKRAWASGPPSGRRQSVSPFGERDQCPHPERVDIECAPTHE